MRKQFWNILDKMFYIATVNGSNSAGNKAIEVPHDESVSIGCSAILF